MSKLVQVYKQFDTNYKRREGYATENQNGQEKTEDNNSHEIPQSDALSSIVEHSNSNGKKS